MDSQQTPPAGAYLPSPPSVGGGVTPEALLRGQDLHRSFGSLRAVRGVSIQVRPGRVAGLIGANGAGKSTLLNLLSGVARPDEGRVLIDSLDVTRTNPAYRSRAGVVRTFQQPRLIGDLTVLENVMIGSCVRDGRTRSLFRIGRQGRFERIAVGRAERALDTAGVARETWLKRARDVPITHHRWVEIARTLAASPRAVLLDEPNSGFTRGETDRLVALLDMLRTSEKVAVLLVTHDVSLALRACDRLTVMHLGEELMTGPSREVLTSQEVASAYLGEKTAKAVVDMAEFKELGR